MVLYTTALSWVRTVRRFWHAHAKNKKMEHMTNMLRIGNESTLYRTTHTNMLRGMRKMLMMVERCSSGT